MAERKKAHEEKETEQAIQPPAGWRIALDNTIWNLTLLARYDGNDAQLGRAITDLEALLAEQPELAPVGGAILEDLDEQ